MSEWWEALTVLQRVFACIALPASFVLILQTLLMLIGIGDHGADTGDGASAHDVHGFHDVHDGHGWHDGHAMHDGPSGHDTHDGHSDHSEGLALFTVRGIVAFFSVGGWAGIIAAGMSVPPVLAILIAWACGSLALYGIALLFKYALRLQSSGNLSLDNAIGKTAEVYITIPGGRTGIGKVTLTFQGRFAECDAMTDEPASLKTGTSVEIIDLVDEDTLLVSPVTAIPENNSDEVE
jgi:hypothetical protein